MLLLFSSAVVCSVMSSSLWPQGLQHARLHCPSVFTRSLVQLMFIELIVPPNHLILCHPLLLLPSVFPSIRVFSNESALCIRWPKYWSFSFIISPSNEYSGLISFRTGWLDLLAVWTLKTPALQFEGINSSALSLFYFSAFTFIHDYWKNNNFDYTDLCRQSDDVSAF